MRGTEQQERGNCVISCPIEPEKLLRSFGRCFSNLLQRNTTCRRNRFGDNARMRRFASLPSKGRWRQVWAISFDHKFPERDFCCDLSHGYTIFESDNARKRNEVLEIENFIRLFERATEAMKDTAQLARVRAQDFERVLPRIPLMNHDVKPKLDGQIELLLN